MTDLGLTWEREQLTGRQYRHIQHLRPIAYRDGSTFRRIVSDWGDSGISARPHIVTASQLMCSVGDDGMRRVHPTREADRYMEIGAPFVKVSGVWRKVSFSNTVRQGNLLAWTRPEANLAIVHADHYIKLGMELKNGYTPEDNLVAFPVGLSGLTRSGAKILADGQTVALLRAPVVYDAANESDVRKIAYQFTSLAGQPYLVMTLPSLAGMTRPIVDPTLTLDEGESGADFDTYINEAAADDAYGSETYLSTRGQGGLRRRPLLKFTLTGIPAGSTITDAELALTVNAAIATNRSNTLHRILAANSGWIEACTWNYADGAGASQRWAGDTGANGGSDAGCSVSGTDYAAATLGTLSYTANDVAGTVVTAELDLTEFGSMWGANYGMVMHTPTDQTSTWNGWASSDHATASYRPKLVIVYTEPGGGGGKPWYAYAQQ